MGRSSKSGLDSRLTARSESDSEGDGGDHGDLG